jgi:rod shape-determining protein MreD
MRISSGFVFFLALFGILFFPQTHVLYFAPYLVLAFYRHTRFAALWRAIGCGALIDLFSSTPHFGLTALNYCVVSWIIYGQTRNFFDDKPSTLPLMTLFFSILSTMASVILFLLFAQPVALTFKWFFSDLIVMPLIDAAYAFALSLPFQITHQLRKVIRTRRRAR